MKKFIIATALLMSISASAQFTVFESIDVPSRCSSTQSTYNPYRSYGTNPYGNQYRSTPKPQAKQYTLTGYYKKQTGQDAVQK